MHPHGKANHVDCFLNVGFPVAALLAVVNLVDYNVVLFLAVGCNIESREYMLGHLANIGYAKPGTESIYNIQMMEERHPVIGVGPASASKVPLPDGHHLHKLNMPKNVAVYGARLQELAERRRDLFNIEGTDL